MDESYAKLEDIKTRLADACGVLNVANARLVELTAELIATELWRGYGIRSVEHYLTLQTGLSPERARQVADVAAATPSCRSPPASSPLVSCRSSRCMR